MPNGVLSTLSKLIISIEDKYALSYKQIIDEIHQTHIAFKNQVSELNGDEHSINGLQKLTQDII